ncbi:hypothetical protein ERJ75_000028100 [Trypanosoma vivax]|nr:hypothetical protein ERJ75_000028100 [Trypanosoma vivax]
MTYQETAFLAQLNGAFVSATTVVARSIPIGSQGLSVEAPFGRQPDHVRGVGNSYERNVRGDVVQYGSACLVNDASDTYPHGRAKQSLAVQHEEMRNTIWLATSGGDIEVRPIGQPDYVVGNIERRPRTTVTSLLQVGQNRVVAALSDGCLRVFDAITMLELKSTRAHSSSVTSMISVTTPTVQRFREAEGSIGGSIFVTASTDCTIAKWNSSSLECLGRFRDCGSGVSALAATLGGAFVFSGALDGSLRMWSMLESIQVVGKSSGSRRATGKAKTKKKVNQSQLCSQKSTPKENDNIDQKWENYLSLMSSVLPERYIGRSPHIVSSDTARGLRSSSVTGSQRNGTPLKERRPRLASKQKGDYLAKPKFGMSLLASACARLRPRLGFSTEDEHYSVDEGSSSNNESASTEELGSCLRSRSPAAVNQNLDKVHNEKLAYEAKAKRQRVKQKKPHSQKVSQFSDIFQQLARSTADLPISRQLASVHPEPRANSKDSETLLWPLKTEHSKHITSLAVVWNRLLVSASGDSRVKVFSLPSGRLIRTVHKGYSSVTGMTVDEARCLLWVATNDGCFHVYNILSPIVQQLHTWRDLSTPRPVLVPLTAHQTSCQLYVLTAPSYKKAAKDTVAPAGKCKPKITIDSGCAKSQRMTTGEDGSQLRTSYPMSPRTEGWPATCIKPSLMCVQVDDADNEALSDMRSLRSLDVEFASACARAKQIESQDAVFKRILGRLVASEGEELKEYLTREQLIAATAVHGAYSRYLLQNLFRRWLAWAARRVSRYLCMRKVRFLAFMHQTRLLREYFSTWRQQGQKNMRHKWGICPNFLEGNLQCPPAYFSRGRKGNALAPRCVSVLARSLVQSLLHRYYRAWAHHVSRVRRNLAQSTAFNRLFLSFYDSKFSDAAFVCRHLSGSAVRAQRHNRACWLLEQRMIQCTRRLQRTYLDKWSLFVKTQTETRHAFSLVDTLSSLLVDEESLRARTYLKWFRFAFFETKLRRFSDERTTMHREWIIVQNAVDSEQTLAELQSEEQQMEVEIARLAFEHDEVQSRNSLLSSDIEFLRLQKSLDYILAAYRDTVDVESCVARNLNHTPRSRRLNNSGRDRGSATHDDDLTGDVAMLQQLSVVLRALKATALRCGRHSGIITASHERVLRLPIYDRPYEFGDRSSSFSISSLGGDSSAMHAASVATFSDKLSNERGKSVTSTTSLSASLSDEFDRTVMCLQAILVDVARQTGVDLEKFTTQSVCALLPEYVNARNSDGGGAHQPVSVDKANTSVATESPNRAPLQWLRFVSFAARAEAVQLVTELVVMFDSFRAHSDTEVEWGGRSISTRGVFKTIPLQLRSLCRVHTASWLLRHAALLLELVSPGMWQRHIKLRALADSEMEPERLAESNSVADVSVVRSPGIKTTPTQMKSTQSVRAEAAVQSRSTPFWLKKKARPKLAVDQGEAPLKGWHASPRVSGSSRGNATQGCQILSKIRPSLQSQKRTTTVSSGPHTPNEKRRDVSSDDGCVVKSPLQSVPSPMVMSNVSTPTKVLFSTKAPRPYLGFRVAVGRDHSGRTTLTIHEVTEKYTYCDGDMERVGPAFAAGLRTGDQLVRFAGYTVTELAAFNAVVARHVLPSASIPVVFSRNGELMTTYIVVGKRNLS